MARSSRQIVGRLIFVLYAGTIFVGQILHSSFHHHGMAAGLAERLKGVGGSEGPAIQRTHGDQDDDDDDSHCPLCQFYAQAQLTAPPVATVSGPLFVTAGTSCEPALLVTAPVADDHLARGPPVG